MQDRKILTLEEVLSLDRRPNLQEVSFEYNESLDAQMLYIINLYQNTTFDYEMRRYLLPENMQCFDM